MSNKITAFLLFSMFVISACGEVIGRPTSTLKPAKNGLPTLTGAWMITMNYSGGIMGVQRSIEIDSTGNYTVKDERGHQSVTSQLSENELANLVHVVNSSQYAPNTMSGACADCFIYNIEITGDGGKFSAQVDDISIEASGLQPLVMSLRGIIEQSLK